MLKLELHEDKVLYLDKKSCNYTGENNFEKIRIVAPKIISGRSLPELKTKLYIINIIDDNWTTLNDCILCEFKEENGELVFEIPVKGQYTVFPQLGMYLKFTDENATVGKTNVVKTMILHHKDSTIDTSNSIELFEQYQNKFEEYLNEIEDTALKSPYIGEDGYWYVYSNGEYICSDVLAQGLPGVKGDTGEKGDKGEHGDDGYSPQIETTKTNKGYDVSITDINGTKTIQLLNGDKGDKGDKGDPGEKGEQGNKGDKGEKGNKGDDYVLTKEDKNEIADMAADINKLNVKLLTEITLEEPVKSITVTTDSDGNDFDLSEIIIYIDNHTSINESDKSPVLSYAGYAVHINNEPMANGALSCDLTNNSSRHLINGKWNGYGWIFGTTSVAGRAGLNGDIYRRTDDLKEIGKANTIRVDAYPGQLINTGTHIKIYGG